ncbi:GNAT family N-acetyltransferase [Streptomyces sp. NPDC026673]|uniref:GNAT family N-acetyltransferase n=1 Tax=Streptomyces sp. NPDC026673 TaxID=3155724 RepID=UPI0033CABA18
MTQTRPAEAAASAWLASMELLARALPGGMCEADGSGTSLLVTGAPLASVNAVVDVNATPQPERIGALAKRAAEELSVPWSIQVRAEPGAELTAIAAELGRTATSLHPFMIKELDDRGTDRPAPGELLLRPVDGRESDAYVAALAAGFEAPAEIMRKMGCPELLDLPGAAAYLAEVDGAAVGTALAFRSDDCVGVFNISVAPAYRGRGYGAAVTAAAVSAERDRGARTAYLHSSPMGLPVYESLGFRTVEHWTHFTA